MNPYTVRRFRPEDAQAVSELISFTSRTIHSKVYEPALIEAFLETVTPQQILERAARTHYYVICHGDTIICSGAIGPRPGCREESEFFNIFLLPQYQGKGIGRRIIETLEQDPFFLQARRVFVHASLTSLKFYQRMGYDHVGGEIAIDEEQLYTLEKLRRPAGEP